jgi:hypothetical protein
MKPVNKLYDGPSETGCFEDGPRRELAKTRLAIIVEKKRRELLGLEHLLKIAEKLEDCSPAEEQLWELFCNRLR